MTTRREQERQQERRVSAADWARQQIKGFEPTAVKLPEGRTWFKPDRAGVRNLDIIPYIVGKGNKNADEGWEDFKLEIAIHQFPMPNGSWGMYLCPWVCWREKCPICLWREQNKGVAAKELIDELRPKTRYLWNVIDLDSKEKAIQVWMSDYYNRGIGFGEQLVKLIDLDPERYGYFPSLKGGYYLRIVFDEHSLPRGGKHYPATRIDFMPRPQDYSKKILEESICLENCLIHYPADELEAVFNQSGGRAAASPATAAASPAAAAAPPASAGSAHASRFAADEDDDDTPPAKAAPKAVDDDDDDLPPAKAKTKPTPVDDDDDPPPVKAQAPVDDGDDDAPPAKVKYKVGDMVNHPKYGECEILAINDDKTLELEDAKGKEYGDVDPAKVSPTKAKPAPVDDDDDAPPAKAKAKPAPVDDDDDPPPVKAKGKKTPPPVDDDNDDDAPPRKKKR